ncbi:hypothetical protein PPMP20_01800 [Paraburkholderia phymatum]|uniref:hypothetical protein n=1 Tax=Paraburkholderia phymatum TaxID=148447 RepID=UPI0012FD5AFA|nr:hypothetical protein [Paraburkholderia phymatum]
MTSVLQNQIDGFSDGKMAVTKECHVHYADQKIPQSISSRFTLNSICFDIDIDQQKEAISNRYGGSYNESTKKWTAYYVDDRDKRLLAPVTHIYPINNGNNSGFARTTDEVIGDPDQRVRFFSYCLFHGSDALCGDGQVLKLRDPKVTLLPYALGFLRSVDFVDPAAVLPAGPANPASATDQ